MEIALKCVEREKECSVQLIKYHRDWWRFYTSFTSSSHIGLMPSGTEGEWLQCEN